MVNHKRYIIDHLQPVKGLMLNKWFDIYKRDKKTKKAIPQKIPSVGLIKGKPAEDNQIK
jgi:hypothetical protein